MRRDLTPAGRSLTVATVALSLVACAHATSPTTTTTIPGGHEATSSPSVGVPGDAWVAVIGSAGDPSRLDPDRKRVLHELGDALEGSIVVSPGACLEGLPERYAQGYVLAIQRASLDDVKALAAQLREPPAFIGAVIVGCTD